MKNIDFTELKRLSKNNQYNKNLPAKNSCDILVALMANSENFNELLLGSDAYTSSSLIRSEHNWLNRKDVKSLRVKSSNKLSYGQVCFIDFGKAYYSEMAYTHCGLYIGKNKGKLLFIPITSVLDSGAYHPVDNPSGDKALRLAKVDEGFSKQCILILNDAKFISPGRIIETYEIIDADVFKQIKMQLFGVMFPDVCREFYKQQEERDALNKQVSCLSEEIRALRQNL
ncbi:MAG: hypothetical protein Q8865_05435 [Bacillota bacterium]|nr:hypothetical protein [Bacillota bacterium]